MDIEEKYQKAFESLSEACSLREKENMYAALGYTSNLDLLCEFKAETLNALLGKYKGTLTLEQMKPADKIRTEEELAESLVYYCLRGLGGEIDVENTGLVKSIFPIQYGMGGTGAQAAMALAAVGCRSVVHLTDDSKEVCDILNLPQIYTVSREGRLIHTGEVAQTQEQEIHFIIQFKKGDVICLRDETAVIPASNRVMLTKVTVNEFVPLSAHYFRWVEDNADRVSSNVLSSFNCLLDADLLKERLEYVKEHVERYRKNNPKGIVFFEDAHYHSYEVRRLCLETICEAADILSLNEEELKYTLKEMYDFDVNIDDILSCIEGAQFIRSRFGIRKGVIVHTKDYAMYVGEPLEADIERGLMYGNMMATAKAMNGWYGTREQIAEVLKLPLSPRGTENLKTVQESPYAGETVLVPSKYIDRPQYTIGLGDSFIGGVQICFGM